MKLLLIPNPHEIWCSSGYSELEEEDEVDVFWWGRCEEDVWSLRRWDHYVNDFNLNLCKKCITEEKKLDEIGYNNLAASRDDGPGIAVVKVTEQVGSVLAVYWNPSFSGRIRQSRFPVSAQRFDDYGLHYPRHFVVMD